ncbi:MAG: hypothetical protein HY778_07875 [Betaproteobacteria bacterium]|nr:hypothetical protein [Betaproteobacteria bacterium]
MKRLPKLKIWHWIVLAVLVAFALDWFVQRPDERSRDLNRAIESEASEQLRAYPYQFRVIRTEGDAAVMTTPRDRNVPALNFLRAVQPDLDVMNANDPAFVAAQTRLGQMQDEARAIVLEQPGVKSVRWELDKRWLRSHGIEVPDK